jgi:diguanylate cyclase (GGDEF)-like protein
VRDSGVQAPIAPTPVTWQQLTSGQHVFDLVSIEGQVAVAVRQATLDEYVIVADGYEFSVIYRHPEAAASISLQPMKEIEPGTQIRVTGICMAELASPRGHDVHFSILLRSPEDIDLLTEPSWFNARHIALLAGLFLLAALLFGARGWFLENRTRREIGSLAYVEKRRARILEDINSSEPLAEILERTTELVSVRLNGAPCWCKIHEGATLGNCPKRLDTKALRVVEQTIAARNGPPLGTMYAAFDARTSPGSAELEALAMAAELATLAIETSRLYSDLVRRSEYDLLTDAQNRFAMERTLDSLILQARQTAGIFGLIYVDLNEFKQVNDVHGHLVGDLYLQEVTLRMKNELRPGDMLARLGGDEFAALVPAVRSRAEVEEIASRLEICFAQPFIGEGYVLRGSASIGVALYPEDASSADELLNMADSAMYTAKYSRREQKNSRMDETDRELQQKHTA